MDYPISVFLDSNIFIACKYNISKDSPLGILLRYVKTGKIKLYLSNIVKREVEAHICESAENAIGYFEKALSETKKHIAENLIEDTSLNPFLNLPTKQCIKDELKTKFEQYLLNSNATILDNQDITCDAILDDYFSGIAPFEKREKKKHEFPDAIMIAKLKKEFPKGKILWVISNDEGVKQALHSESQFQCLSRLQDLYDLINKNDHVYQEIKNYFSSNVEKIDSIVLEKIGLCEIEVDGTDCDSSGVVDGFEYDETDILRVSNLEVELDSVDEISESNVIVTTLCSAHFLVWGSYNDFNKGIWDSEDKEYVFVPRYDIYEEHEASFYCELKLHFKEENPHYSFSIESIDCDLKLDQDTRVKRYFHDSEKDEEVDW